MPTDEAPVLLPEPDSYEAPTRLEGVKSDDGFAVPPGGPVMPEAPPPPAAD